MSALLNVPLDFQSLPEYRLLVIELQRHLKTPGDVEASFLFTKLWVNLGYEARRHNEPGWLSPVGRQLFGVELQAVLAEEVWLAALVRCGMLARREDDSGWDCPTFARFNPHLAGNYERKEHKAARRSAIVRNKEKIAAEVITQSMLLPPEIYKTREGRPFEDWEVKQVLTHIRTLDRCLRAGQRLAGDYTAGLVADAHAALVDVPKEERARNEFYFWFDDHREHPALPRTTDQVLGDWPRVMAMKKAMGKAGNE